MSWNRSSSACAPALLPPSPGVIAGSARVLGRLRLGASATVAQGTVVRSLHDSVDLGNHSVVLENSVVIGTPAQPVRIGRRTVFGHRCQVIGATVGDLCEIGNGSVLLPGARLGDRCFLGEGTLIAAGTLVPAEAVLVGRPGRVLRRANADDLARLARLREGQMELTDEPGEPIAGAHEAGANMGNLYAYKDKQPRVAASAILFDSAEVTGDVSIGDETIIGAGVKIIGDSHGPVRIGNRVQILENAVLHLLPDNELIIDDDVVIGPGGMIHGCHIGAGTIVEPAAIVCDWAVVGRNCLVRAGSIVVQRSRFADNMEIAGCLGEAVVGLAEGEPPVAGPSAPGMSQPHSDASDVGKPVARATVVDAPQPYAVHVRTGYTTSRSTSQSITAAATRPPTRPNWRSARWARARRSPCACTPNATAGRSGASRCSSSWSCRTSSVTSSARFASKAPWTTHSRRGCWKSLAGRR